MKAAVLHQLGAAPEYDDFPDPVPAEGQALLTVRAATIKNIDKGRASGAHYASYTELPVVVGLDAVGTLADGSRVYAQGITGTIAEKALIAAGSHIQLPDGLSDTMAAALPNAVVGAALAILFRAKMKQGDVVLINGATGVTGQVAVQLARHYGASKVIATGRNADALAKLQSLGADATVSLLQDDDDVVAQLRAIHAETPIGIVIDYLWGKPVALVIRALKGPGGMRFATGKLRVVTVGSMAGEEISLPSGVLRSSDIEILGSGFGSLSADDFARYRSEVLPEIFRLAADGQLGIDTEEVPLSGVEAAWNHIAPSGKRIVVVM